MLHVKNFTENGNKVYIDVDVFAALSCHFRCSFRSLSHFPVLLRDRFLVCFLWAEYHDTQTGRFVGYCTFIKRPKSQFGR